MITWALSKAVYPLFVAAASSLVVLARSILGKSVADRSCAAARERLESVRLTSKSLKARVRERETDVWLERKVGSVSAAAATTSISFFQQQTSSVTVARLRSVKLVACMCSFVRAFAACQKVAAAAAVAVAALFQSQVGPTRDYRREGRLGRFSVPPSLTPSALMSTYDCRRCPGPLSLSPSLSLLASFPLRTDGTGDKTLHCSR